MLMTIRLWFDRLAGHEGVNFALTNRIPRRTLTRLMGRMSRIEHPWFVKPALWLWRQFGGLNLEEARKQRFASLHDCFVRELKPGARPIDTDPATLVAPCDAIVGACGQLDGVRLIQAKGHHYFLHELLDDPELAARYRDGCYATLRITACRYHRFHAPLDGHVPRIDYIAGDAFNVNPPAVARIAKLYCRNERAVVRFEVEGQAPPVLLVPVAAILVASIRFTFTDVRLHLKYAGPNRIDCDAALAKGDEMGWFEHGSTIIVIAPRGYTLAPGIASGLALRMGGALMRTPKSNPCH